MQIINLKKYYYPYYTEDVFVEVSDEVAEVMRLSVREMKNYERRTRYHRAFYSLDAYSWMENYALEHGIAPEEILLQAEEQTAREKLASDLPEALCHAIVIFVIVYGRMIEIYLTVSLAPIPFSTMANREWGQMGTNYLRSLFALGFQGFLILVCVAIYAVLVQSIPSSGDIHGAIWGTAGYTVLLAFALFKTGSLSKSIFNSH